MRVAKIKSSNGEVFNSIRELSKKLHRRRITISSALKDGFFESDGVKYSFLEEKQEPKVEKEVSVDTLVDNHTKFYELKQAKTTIKKLVDEVAMLRERQGLLDSLQNVKHCDIKPRNTNFEDGDNTAVALFSDVHWETRIEPDKVGGLNEYNPTIAKERCDKFFIRLCSLIKEEQVHRPVSTLVIGVLGDLINGWLREEAMQTNYQDPNTAAREVKKMLVKGLRYVKSNANVNKIICTMLVGNHSRMTPKIQHSNQAETSIEYAIYKDIQECAEEFGLEDIEFRVPKGVLDFINVYGYVIAFAHGHMGFRYNGGVGGIFVPLNKYFSNLNNREHVDYLCIGHYHSLTYLKNIVVNGSVCGIDSFAYNLNLPYEKPQQALFFINSKYGRSKALPIFVD